MIDMDATLAAIARYENADEAIKAAEKRCDDLIYDTQTARRSGSAQAEKKAKADHDTYNSEVWYPAFLDLKAAAGHLAEALGLDPARLGSALR